MGDTAERDRGTRHDDNRPPSEAFSRRMMVIAGSAAVAGLGGGCALFKTPPPLSAASAASVPNGPAARGRLEGKVALVTGAGRGIGRAIATAYAREGCDIALLDLAGPVSAAVPYPPSTPEDLSETQRLVESQGRRATRIIGDVRSAAAMRQAAEQALATLGLMR